MGTQDAVGSWVVDGAVVRGRPDGLRAYGLQTGETRWSWTVPGEDALLAMSRTAVGGVGLAVHADEDASGGSSGSCTVTAVDTGRGTALWSVSADFSEKPWHWEKDRAGQAVVLVADRAVVLAGGRPTAYALTSGRSVWAPVAPLADDGQLAAARQGVVQISVEDGAATVRCLDPAEGAVRWQVRPLADRRSGGVHVLHEDPLVLLVEGRGRRAAEPELLVLDTGDGRTTARIPVHGPHGEARVQPGSYGLPGDRPVAVVADVLAVAARPPGTYTDHVTAFALDGGRQRWTWKSEGLVLGVLEADEGVAVLSKWEATEGGDGAVHLHLLDHVTGTVRWVRRLAGYEAGMRGRYHLDAELRLIRVGHWGHGDWRAVQAFRLR
ncbi:hypothetical protein [Streptomyces sp. NPDC020983]|uniref:hypothetical protein n=1 Tax=Streptomyces sp. NPDC020983 TaxID=3365106 RepID=UPI003787DBD2